MKLIIFDWRIDRAASTRPTSTGPHQQHRINRPASTGPHQQGRTNRAASTVPHQQARINRPASTGPHQQARIDRTTSTGPHRQGRIDSAASTGPHRQGRINRAVGPTHTSLGRSEAQPQEHGANGKLSAEGATHSRAATACADAQYFASRAVISRAYSALSSCSIYLGFRGRRALARLCRVHPRLV